MKKIKGEITLEYPSRDDVVKIQKSLKVDDESFVKSQVENKMLKSCIESASIPSFLHTIDDYLACVTIAENLILKKDLENKQDKKR